MAKLILPYLSFLLIISIFTHLTPITRLKQQKPLTNFLNFKLLNLNITSKLLMDETSLSIASNDFGNLIHINPIAVFYPSSTHDIVYLLIYSYTNTIPFKIAPRGRGHSCRGQAMAKDGIVIDMTSLNRQDSAMSRNIINGFEDEIHINNNNNNNNNNIINSRVRVLYEDTLGYYYADVGGEQLWIDVLHATLVHGVAPVSWTDYLYLSVGGTLSNAGISGQAFRYGPQISNVFELDVVTGKGELVTCSNKLNQELFYAVLGGLGQFGIITRARIALQIAPKRVKWVRMLYDDFSTFTRDQEHLISKYGDQGLSFNDGVNYVEGSVIIDEFNPINNWRSSSFFSSNEHSNLTSLHTPTGVIYCLELAKYYYDNVDYYTTNKELEKELKGLNYIGGYIFKKDVSFVEFLNRVRKGEMELEAKGLWDVPHPWLNLFIPRSNIQDFAYVFDNIIVKHSNGTTGPILIYPMNRNKWDDKMSAITIEDGEEVFYTIGFLHSNGFDGWEALENLNKEILNFCKEKGIKIKQYLPYYTKEEDWKIHFGSKWQMFQQRKVLFDPKMILSPGQRIFN